MKGDIRHDKCILECSKSWEDVWFTIGIMTKEEKETEGDTDERWDQWATFDSEELLVEWIDEDIYRIDRRVVRLDTMEVWRSMWRTDEIWSISVLFFSKNWNHPKRGERDDMVEMGWGRIEVSEGEKREEFNEICKESETRTEWGSEPPRVDE